jgi:hypothetical protein
VEVEVVERGVGGEGGRGEERGVRFAEPGEEVAVLEGLVDGFLGGLCWYGRAGELGGVLTGVVVLVGIVGSVLGAWPEYAPEGTAAHAGSETGDVDMAVQAALGKGLAEGLIVDVVVVKSPYMDGQVVVPVCQGG